MMLRRIAGSSKYTQAKILPSAVMRHYNWFLRAGWGHREIDNLVAKKSLKIVLLEARRVPHASLAINVWPQEAPCED